jgi:periplasmic mercuric ion binding protein
MNRTQFLSALAALLTTGFSFTAQATGDPIKEVKVKTSAICEMCKSRIERNLSFEKGVKEADLNVDTKVVTIRYDAAKTDLSKLKAVIVRTGYDADELPADTKGYAKLPSCCKKGGDTMHH